MKRMVSFGLVLAILCCILLMPGCAQRHVTASPKDESVALAGGSSGLTHNTAGSNQVLDEDTDSVAPDGDSSDDTGADLGILTQTRTQEYGTCSNYAQQDGSLTLRFNHPSGDIPALDQAVVDQLIQTGQNFLAGLEAGSSAALVASYDSYEVNGRVVSVLVSGSLSYSHDVAPQSLFCTFNADRTTGQLLTLQELLREGGEETLRQMAAERAGVDANREDLLSNWLLTSSGLLLYLDGQPAAEFTYLELLGILDLPNPERVIDPSKPMIALTFDDGPSNNTSHILDLLQFYNCRATFYVVGNRVSSYADAIRRCAELGNEIGIHTWEHAKLTGLSREEISSQITRTEQAVEQYAGATCASVRPPGGSYNDTVKSVAAELGYYLVNWSVDTEDWKTRDADATYNAIMADAYDGAIVLCHDLYASTASAMDRVIPELMAQGYQLVTVSELLSYREGGAVPGNLYTHR